MPDEMNLELMYARLVEAVGDRTSSQVAADVGVPQSSASMYLHGKRFPKVGFLKKIAELYGVNIEWLLGYPDAPKYPDLPQEGVVPDEDIVLLSRAAKKMSPANRKKLIEMARLMFDDFD